MFISQRIHEKQWKIATGQYTEADARREARRHMPWWGRLIGFMQHLWRHLSLVTASMNHGDYGEEIAPLYTAETILESSR